MNELALFAGTGGGILGGMLAGFRTVCAVEIDRYCRRILLARQNDGILPPFPIWDDVRTFDGRRWRGIVDVVSGGFPCQDISIAGSRAGIEGGKSGLWQDMARIIGDVRPPFVFVENSPAIIIRGIDRITSDLARMGYCSEWGIISASECGAFHNRRRFWLVAYSDSFRQLQQTRDQPEKRDRSGICGTHVSNSDSHTIQGLVSQSQSDGFGRQAGLYDRAGGTSCGEAGQAEPRVDRVVDRVANRMDRLRAIGNGQVPRVVAVAWATLSVRAMAPGPGRRPLP